VRESVDLPFERGIRPVRSARLVFAVDTSGSIDDEILGRFVAEMCSAIESMDPLIRLIVCDADVHQVFDLSGPEAVQRLRTMSFKGGGGTDFRPAISAAAEWKPDCMVYLTDLQGETGSQPRFPVLWAVPPGYSGATWGRIVELL
jgi:predicted metal-dependent peptidase